MWLRDLLAAPKQHCAPLERALARTTQAINIAPRWGEDRRTTSVAFKA
jgi:hypothetical protein